MAIYIELYDSRNYYIGEDGEYQKWNIDPRVIEEATDVVEVVRCKDCVHLEILNGSTYYARCGRHGRLFGSFGRADTRTWFCADGERRSE